MYIKNFALEFFFENFILMKVVLFKDFLPNNQNQEMFSDFGSTSIFLNLVIPPKIHNIPIW